MIDVIELPLSGSLDGLLLLQVHVEEHLVVQPELLAVRSGFGFPLLPFFYDFVSVEYFLNAA